MVRLSSAVVDAARATQPAAESARRAGVDVHTVYVALVRTTGNPGDDVTHLTEPGAEALVDDLHDYWTAESDGAVSVQFGGFVAVSGDSCDLEELLFDTAEVAFDDVFANDAWVGTNNHLVSIPAENCRAANGGALGLGTLDYGGGLISSVELLAAGTSPAVLAHEFGHNLGFEHANVALCTGGECDISEYEDLLDVMGFADDGVLPHLSAPLRIREGYLTDYSMAVESDGDTTVTLDPLASDGDTRALRVRDPLTHEFFVVELRIEDTSDADSDDMKPGGVVRLVREYSDTFGGNTTYGTQVIGSAPDYSDLGLTSGQSRTAPTGGFAIDVVSIDPTAGAQVRVRFLHDEVIPIISTPAPTTPPTVTQPSPETTAPAAPVPSRTTISIPKKKIAPKKKSKATVIVSAAVLPTGTVTVYIGKKRVATATLTATKNGRVVVTLPKLKKGRYTLTARYSGAASVSASRTIKAVVLKVR